MCQLRPSKPKEQEVQNHSDLLYNVYTNDSVRHCPISRPCCLERQGLSALPHAAAVTCGIWWPPEGHPRSMGVCHSVQHAPPGATQRTRILYVMHRQNFESPSGNGFPGFWKQGFQKFSSKHPPFQKGSAGKGGCFRKTRRRRLLEITDFRKMVYQKHHFLEGAFQEPPSGMVGNPFPEARGGFQKPPHKFC